MIDVKKISALKAKLVYQRQRKSLSGDWRGFHYAGRAVTRVSAAHQSFPYAASCPSLASVPLGATGWSHTCYILSPCDQPLIYRKSYNALPEYETDRHLPRDPGSVGNTDRRQ
jgi:hypothetical protein